MIEFLYSSAGEQLAELKQIDNCYGNNYLLLMAWPDADVKVHYELEGETPSNPRRFFLNYKLQITNARVGKLAKPLVLETNV